MRRGMTREEQELVERGTVTNAHASCMVVEVDGVELYVGPRIHRTGCDCCGDTAVLTVSYNRGEEDRIEACGEADPFGLEVDG